MLPRRILDDLEKLEVLLNSLLTPLLSKRGGGFRVLNLACGRADETGVLLRVFERYTEELFILGLDIREKEIKDAARLWRLFKRQTLFLHQDATKLDDLLETKEPFDIVFMRHQNYWHGDKTWRQIYDAALHRLKTESFLVITSYFDREHLLAVDALTHLGAKLVYNIQNTHSRMLNEKIQKSVDRHLAVFSLQQRDDFIVSF